VCRGSRLDAALAFMAVALVGAELIEYLPVGGGAGYS